MKSCTMQERMFLFTVGVALLGVGIVVGESTFLSSHPHCVFLQGSDEIEHFKQTPSVRVIYHYKKETQSLKFFIKELDKAAEFLDLYGVKTGIVDCTESVNAATQECEEASEKQVYTYRSGHILLSLELETMFDVNSIMSNILQLVMLREVPILQSSDELQKYLYKFRGKQDVIFGYVKAIGTFNHRVFMEVAFAYQQKIKFAICTDKQATTLFDDPPQDNDQSTIWWVSTSTMKTTDTKLTSVQYKGEFNLATFAKFVMSISLPRMFEIPRDGKIHPYSHLDLSIVRFFFDSQSREDIYKKAKIVADKFLGLLSVVLVDMDNVRDGEFMVPISLPACSLQMKGENSEHFAPEGFSSDTLTMFLDHFLDRSGSQDNKMYDMVLEEDDETRMPKETKGLPANINIEEVETQDDEVAEAVYRAQRKPLDLHLVPALTDKTFPKQVAASPLLVVIFYIPFDYISLANLRKIVDARELLGETDRVSVARVNCYDWTDVCQHQNILLWPTLRVFRDGVHIWDYKGPQDTAAMYSTLKLLDMSPPVQLSSKEMVTRYIKGDPSLTSISNVSVIGLFSPSHKKEMALFKEISQDYSDRIIYAFTDIKEAADIASQYEGRLPTVLLSRYDDPLQTHIRHTGSFSKAAITEFIYNNKLPILPELTPLIFPEMRRRSSNLVILFTDSTEQSGQSHDTLREVVKGHAYKNVSFSFMDIPNKVCVGYKVLSQYTKSPTLPFLSFVNFNKGEVYNFDGSQFDSDHVTQWLGSVVERSVPPSVTLKAGEWKPLNKGYEFLKIIDYEKEQEEKEEKDGNNKKESMHPPMDEMDIPDSLMGYHQSTMEGEEDADMRKDLIDLVNSRLYHQNQARHDKYSHRHDNQGQTSKHQTHDPGEL